MINYYVILMIFMFELKNLIRIFIEFCVYFEEKVRNFGKICDLNLKMKNILLIFLLNEIVFICIIFSLEIFIDLN